jgi:trk system potassium uptake protein TrkA
MKAVIVGCGRVGAGFADILDRAGWNVLILDTSAAAFDRLPSTFSGTAIRGDGIDEDVLRRAGAEGADLFLTLTEGDNRNVMAAQMAAETLGARRAVAKVNDPVRAGAYTHLGIATLCRTQLMLDALLAYLGMAAPAVSAVNPPERLREHEGTEQASGEPESEA